ncbi:membrane protein [Streptomyces mashuensis]|uniref:Membrane protein n=1 Tax=Streptomyces mashuensis TaxID=33904 RepID=A0A919B3U9_9ACTN|nr:hypothetical protein [Streptomyces mashuensis]GHF42849.1 membrane protein [Streptomyces mashuensis]
MNSDRHLPAEDRQEFERVLDQALRAAKHDPELAAAIGKQLSAEQLRAMALSAMAAITACASAEYRDYAKARDKLRARPAAARPRPDGGGVVSGAGPEDDGAGAAAVLAVLAPTLSGIAAMIFLLIGYVTRTVGVNESVAGPMISIGWWFGALTVAGALVAMAGMLVTALRNGRGAPADEPVPDPLAEEAERAREAWRQALLDRGVRPFLREALTGTPSTPRTPRALGRAQSPSRTPRPGHARPGFSRPEWTSPDFTGPDRGPDRGPEFGNAGRSASEHRPE